MHDVQPALCDLCRPETEEQAVGATYCAKMDDLLRSADFVMVVVNLSPQTQKLIGAKELAMMKSTATLINISRGHYNLGAVSNVSHECSRAIWKCVEMNAQVHKIKGTTLTYSRVLE